MVEVRTRASEAKGPFPGGKRVGSRGKKKKAKVKEKVIEKERSPSSEVDELKGRNTSVKNVQVLKGYGVYGEIFQSRWILPF